MRQLAAVVALLTIPMAFAASEAAAQDTLKLAIPMRGNWENAAPDLGERVDIFKKHGIALERVYTQGTGETIQVVISGSVDIGQNSCKNDFDSPSAPCLAWPINPQRTGGNGDGLPLPRE